MSDNLENQNVSENSEITVINGDDNLESSEKTEKIESEKSGVEPNNSVEKQKGEFDLGNFAHFLKSYADKKAGIEKEEENRRVYLSSNLPKYDTEDYFQNESFRNLYSEAFRSLGTNLDTDKFVNLLNNYVNSRIEAFSKKSMAAKENESLTDSFDFEPASASKSETIPKMQDIPPEELEKYIAKYI